MRNYDAGHVSFVMGSMVNVVSFFIFFVFVLKKKNVYDHCNPFL